MLKRIKRAAAAALATVLLICLGACQTSDGQESRETTAGAAAAETGTVQTDGGESGAGDIW